MNDIVDLVVDRGAKELPSGLFFSPAGNFSSRPTAAPQPLNMLEPVGARTGAAGVADPFFPRHHFEHGSRKLATSVPMIDLEGQGVSTRLPFGHPSGE